MARIFTYRGRDPEAYKNMPMDQYLKLVNSRERRSIKRMGIQFKQLVEAVEKAKKKGDNSVIRTRVRSAVILPSWLGMRFAVHNGKEYKEIEIRPEMLGHRLGEYSFTTKHVQHSAPGIRATRGSKFLAVK
ncbi:MAG: 30S ribosomal protein S19 [Candidatus Micrarchaeaceae archaeon]